MFANIIKTNGKPVCPMAGCHQEIEPGTSEGFTVAPEALRKLHAQGLLAEPSGIVLVHTACAS